jgi:hypothetical protein
MCDYHEILHFVQNDIKQFKKYEKIIKFDMFVLSFYFYEYEL